MFIILLDAVLPITRISRAMCAGKNILDFQFNRNSGRKVVRVVHMTLLRSLRYRKNGRHATDC